MRRLFIAAVVAVMLFVLVPGGLFAQAAATEVVLDATKAGHQPGSTARFALIEQAGSSTYVFLNGACRVEISWTNTGVVYERMFGTTRWSGLPGGVKHTIADGSVTTATSGEISWSYLPRSVGQVAVSMEYDYSPTCEGNVSVGGIFPAYKAPVEVYAYWEGEGFSPVQCGSSDCRYKINDVVGNKFPDRFMAQGVPYKSTLGKFEVNMDETRGPGGAKVARVSPEVSQEVTGPTVFTLFFQRPVAVKGNFRK